MQFLKQQKTCVVAPEVCSCFPSWLVKGSQSKEENSERGWSELCNHVLSDQTSNDYIRTTGGP